MRYLFKKHMQIPSWTNLTLEHRILQYVDSLLFYFISSALCIQLFLVSSREYSLEGAVGVFVVLASFSLALIFSTRYVITAITILILVFGAFDLADHLKLQFVGQHFNFSDILVIFGLSFSGFFALLRLYMPTMLKWLYFAATAAFGLLFLIIYEYFSTKRRRRFKAMQWSLLVVWAAAVTNAFIFLNSAYMQAIASQNFVWAVANPGPFRYSYFISNLRTYIRLRGEFALTAGAGELSHSHRSRESPSQQCQKCPDIIVFHVESVFDPIIIKEYEHDAGLMDRLQKRHIGRNGFLLVNTWGGYSFISEFELLCGTNHSAFGRAGLAAPVTISNFATDCAPRHLKSLGYDTSAIYSTSGAWLNVSHVFKNYGFDTIYDTRDLKLPDFAFSVKDKVFTNKLLQILSQPRNRPRFIWVSTNWNHGPHGLNFPIFKTRFPGPFDISKTNRPDLKDYINRLNDSYTNLVALEDKIMQLPYPVAILEYGDHQPGFDLNFTTDIVERFRARKKFVTFFRMLKNTPGMRPPTPSSPRETIHIETILAQLLRWIDVPLSPAMLEVERITRLCGGDQIYCSDEQSEQLRHAVMR